MTQRIIISILFLVTVSLGSNNATASRQDFKTPVTENTGYVVKSGMSADLPGPTKSVPMFPAGSHETPHGKAAHVPHMEELPHIHRYHKERVKKITQHHTKFWFLGQLVVVVCQLTLLFIAYLHVIH